jgi:hypothetical protein
MIFLFLLLIYLFGGFILCVCLGLFLRRKTSSVPVGIATFCACFALFYGNEIYEHYKWKNLCKTAGNYVYKTVKTDSLFYDRLKEKENYKRNLEEGYEFVEGRLYGYKVDPQQIYRFSLDDTGNLIYVPIDRPASRYTYRREQIEIRPYITEYVSKFVDLESNQPIALSRSFHTRGGAVVTWLKEHFSTPEGSSSPCFGNTSTLFSTAVSPINRSTKP